MRKTIALVILGGVAVAYATAQPSYAKHAKKTSVPIQSEGLLLSRLPDTCTTDTDCIQMAQRWGCTKWVGINPGGFHCDLDKFVNQLVKMRRETEIKLGGKP